MVRFWTQLAVPQRIVLGLSALAVVAGMVSVAVLSGNKPMKLLYGRLGEKDLAAVLALLQEQSIKHEVSDGGSAVYVPAEKVHQLRAQLAAKGVPSGGGVGFEIFDRTNFGISDFVQRTNYVRALQGELGRTIAQINGVRSANVMIVMPENRLLFTDTKTRPTASVFIEQAAGALSREAVNSIRFLVANAVEGLGVNDVAVVDSSGNVLTEQMQEDGTLGTASAQMKYRKSVEDYFVQKVESMLARVLGPNKAVVRVSADIDTESSSTVQETYDPEGQVIRNEVITEDNSVTNETDGRNDQAVGVSANTPDKNEANKGATQGKSTEESRKNRTNTYEINKTVTNAVKNPGRVTRVTAAVFLAAKEQPRSQQEMDLLKKMVANVLGVNTQNEQDQAVLLQEVPFETSAQKSAAVGQMLFDPEMLRAAVGLLAGAGVIFVLFRMLKRTKPMEIPMELLDPQAASLLGDGKQPLSVDMLNEMIRQKPANVGAALKGWLEQSKESKG